jgi:hypothetical protein
VSLDTVRVFIEKNRKCRWNTLQVLRGNWRLYFKTTKTSNSYFSKL